MANSPSPLRQKSYVFALDTIKLCKKLRKMHEYEFAKQLLKSGTSIGANIEEATRAHSKRDFVAKLAIAHKEAAETDFWLRLLIDSYMEKQDAIILRKNLDEIIRMLTASIKKLHVRNDQ